jgi:AraC family transcriptional regulator
MRRQIGRPTLGKTIMALDEPSARLPVPERTSPIGLENYISGNTVISGDGPAWRDAFVQVLSRGRAQHPFLVPAVAEPLIDHDEYHREKSR